MRFEVVTTALLGITVPSPSASSKSRRFFLDLLDPEDEGTEILPHVRNYIASDDVKSQMT